MKKKILAGILSVCMLVSLLPQVSYAQTGASEGSTVPADISVQIPEVGEYGEGPYYQVPFDFGETENFPVLYNTDIPTSYDSREFLPEVRNQNPYGTCWTFGTMAAAESSLIFRQEQIHGVVADSSINLSEYQLARFQYFHVDDPLNNTTGDQTVAVYNGVDITGAEAVGAENSYLNRGGSQAYATWSMAGWKAGADETTAPYDSIAETAGVLEDSVAYEDIVHMQNAYWLPMSEPDVIKAMLMEYGALGSSYIHGESACTYDENGVCSYYSGMTQEEANAAGFYGHAIAIVGWDDDYSVENFSETCRPTGNGAWLIRNSWGSEWSDNGYFWISYEELTLDTVAYAYEFEDADNYDYNYQYDGSCGIGTMSHTEEISYGNVFEIKGEGNQILEAVGIGVSSSGVSYELQIYKNPQEGDPDSGTPMLTEAQTGVFTYPGYYTVELEKPIYLEQGSSFSVVFTISAGAEIFVDMSYDGGFVRFVSDTEANQSFMFCDYWCVDFASEGYECCARIKAYTNSAENLITEITKAEPGKDGSIDQYYKEQILISEKINAPENLELAETIYEFDGTVKYPEVIGVYDIDGEEITAENYEISYSNQESAEPGTYEVTVTFKGDYYTGTITRSYWIYQPKITYHKPGGLQMVSNTATSITVSWTQSDMADGYYLYISDAADGAYKEIAKLEGNDKTSYTYENLEAGKNYYFKLTAYALVAEEIFTSTDSAVLEAATQEEVKDTTPEDDGNTSGGGTTEEGNGNTSGGGTTEGENESTSGDGTIGEGNENTSGGSGTNISQEQMTAPGRTASLKAASQKTTSIKLSWGKVNGASGYEIYHYNTSGKKWVKLASVDGNTTKYTSKKLKAGTKQKYKVRAYKQNGSQVVYGSYSKVLTTYTKPAKVKAVNATAGTNYVKLRWKKVTGADGYQIYTYSKAKKKYVKTATIKKGKIVSKKLTSLKAGTTYKYKIKAYKKVGKKYIYGSFSSVKVIKTKK